MDEDNVATVVAISACAATVAVIAASDEHVQRKDRARQPRFLRAALLQPMKSDSKTAWRQLLSCGSSSDFLVELNVDRHVFFDVLLPFFIEERATLSFGSLHRTAPKTTGRLCTLRTEDIMALVLWGLKSSVRQQQLCPVFGLVPTTVSVWYDYSLKVLYRTLRPSENPPFSCCWPTTDEIDESSELLQGNRPFGHLLKGVFAVVDGGRFPYADYVDKDVKNAYFEGYTQAVEVTNLLVYNFKGEIIHAAINHPSSFHDSSLETKSGLMFPKMTYTMTLPGREILGDSDFATCRVDGKIVRARKTNETGYITKDTVLGAIDMIMQRIMLNERQSAEWGVKARKGPFRILRLTISASSKKRYRILCVRLLNLRTRLIGNSQIRTVYANESEEGQHWKKRLIEEMDMIQNENENTTE